MRFLLINQFFAPDPAPTGQLLADVARALIVAGHSVQVVCGGASYVACDTAGDHDLELVDVRRVGITPFRSGLLSRIVSYVFFLIIALRYAAFGKRADVVLTLTTPPLLSLTGTLAKLLRGSRHVIWEMDVYPDIAVALGVIASGGVLDRTVGGLADLSRHQADKIIVLGSCMSNRLANRGIPLAKLAIAQNWVDGRRISPRRLPDSIPVVLLYSGNLGRAHDTATLDEAMKTLSSSNGLQFIFAGAGEGYAELRVACELRRAVNVQFLPYQDGRLLADHLGRCHIGIVTQRASTCGAVVPSKTYGLMAAGRPFIFIGPAEATPAQLIRAYQCGWHVMPGDSEGLVALLQLLAGAPRLIEEAARRARHTFLESYELQIGASRVVRILTDSEVLDGMPKAFAAAE
jgi:glycosyltransferase involved in cell wall biosynthesis